MMATFILGRICFQSVRKILGLWCYLERIFLKKLRSEKWQLVDFQQVFLHKYAHSADGRVLPSLGAFIMAN